MIVVQWAAAEEKTYTRREYSDEDSQMAWDHYAQVVEEWDAARIFLEDDDNHLDWVVLNRTPKRIEETKE